MRCIQTILNSFFIMALVYSIPTQALAQSGTWTPEASMPSPREGPAVGVIGGKLYVAGGCCVSLSPPYPRFNVLEVYDPVMNNWSTMAPMPLAIYAGADGVIDGKLYVAGGQADQSHGNNVANLQVYDPATNTWSNNAPMPFASGATAAGVIGGMLYVAGGQDPSNTVPLNTLRVYDPVTDQWAIKASMPTARSSVGVGIVNGILYVIGGGDSIGNVLPTVEAYDPSTDSWTTKAPMPTARYGPSVGVINGILYVTGGFNGTEVNVVEAYDPATDTWTPQTPMPTARVLPAGGVVNGVFYVVGGQISAAAPYFTAANEAFSIAPVVPTKINQCKNDGWQTFGVFKNQGDCVSFVATKGRNQ